jgi:hypothetical protein
MAEPISLDDFEAVPAKGVSLDSFDSPPPAKAIALDDFESFPVGQPEPAKDLPIEEQVMAGIGEAIPEDVKDIAAWAGQQFTQSATGKALEKLNTPLKAAAGLIVEGLDKTTNPGIKKALNPENRWIPEIAYHDILNYVAPTNDQVEKLAEYGFGPGVLSQASRLMYAGARTGVGLAADLFLDPLVGVGIFGKIPKVAEAVSSAAKAVEKIPPVGRKALKTAAGAGLGYDVAGLGGAAVGGMVGYNANKILDAFDYRTGIEEVDTAASLHAGFKRGDQAGIVEGFVDPIRKLKLTDSENSVLASAIEGTKNSASRDDILAVALEQAAKKGVQIESNRLEQIADAGKKIKDENALDIQERVGGGLLFVDPKKPEAVEGLIENYLVHKISPEAKAYARKNPELAAAAQEAILAKRIRNDLRESTLSTFDSGKYSRKIQTTLEEANSIMKDKTGVAKWFIDDPLVATAMKRADTKRLLRDKELIEKISKHGIPKSEALKKGLRDYRPIRIPEYRGSLPSDDLVFPPKIADKIGYYVTPRETGQFVSYLDSYNRLFRTFALAKMDYYMQNWGENVFKNWVQGVKLSDYADLVKISKGRGDIDIGGKKIPAIELRRQIQKYGIDSGGQFVEGLEPALFAAKKMMRERVKEGIRNPIRGAADAVKSGFGLVREAGVRGENYTRRALFLNRLKKGMSAEAAALDVEKYLFDFSRTTKSMDTLRRFYDPFIQAAIKSAYIMPEMLLKAPEKYNFLHNNMMGALEAAAQDPVTASEVKAILPYYRQIQDPIVGPILTGNNWLYKIFTNTSGEPREELGGKTAVLFKAPIGADILNRFALWDQEVGKQGGLISPLIRSFAIYATGRDPFTGKNIDPPNNAADTARRLNYAFNSTLESAVPFPNTLKLIKQELGIGDVQYFTPRAVLLLHGNLGKFVNVTNLDKEYFFRKLSFHRAHQGLMKEMVSRLTAEMQGRTADLRVSDKPFLKRVLDEVNQYSSSRNTYSKILKNRRDAAATLGLGEHLSEGGSLVEIIRDIKDLERQNKLLNKQYEVSSEYRLQVLKDAKEEEIREIVPESDGE